MIHTRVIAGRRLCVVSLSVAAAAQAMMLAAMPGCAEKKPAPSPAVQPAKSLSAASQSQRQMSALQKSVDELAESAKALPGRTEEAHRQLMADYFGNLREVLPLLAPDDQTGAFRQQLAILESSQNKLTSHSTKSLDEPVINTGLRAGANALTQMAGELDLSNAAALTRPVGDKLNALDGATGPAHRLAARDVVDAQTNLVKALAVVVSQRMNLAMQLDEASASQSTSRPTSRPAAEPAAKANAAAPASKASSSAAAQSAAAPAAAATVPATQLIPTTVPAEPAAPPANQPTPRAATQSVTPAPADGGDREMNKQ